MHGGYRRSKHPPKWGVRAAFFIRSCLLISFSINAISASQLQNAGDPVPLTRQDIILSALAAAGENALFSPVQVQKLFFLIDRKAAHLLGGPHFAFRPYDYGPFDPAVYDQLTALGFSGHVQLSGSGRYRSYSLTPQGFVEGQRILTALPAQSAGFLKAVAQWILKLNFQQLVSAIYREYPDMKVNSIFHG